MGGHPPCSVRCWPPCFNGAAGVCPRMGACQNLRLHRARRASMGPRGFARGWHSPERSSGSCSHASMGPRGFARGWDDLIGQNFSPSDASMGPRGFARGWKQIGNLASANADLLQWGRGGLPADGTRGLSACWRKWRASMGPRGFARGWRDGVKILTPFWQASMGPRGFARGWCRDGVKILTPFWRASMGPRGFARGWRLRLVSLSPPSE